ncbi:MAG: hypothetical protein WB775_11825 [Burkholderiaceae bacterium]
MRITPKPFASLSDCLPAHARSSHVIGLDVAPDAPIRWVIEPFGRWLSGPPV